jgi:predicted dehydrogenase
MIRVAVIGVGHLGKHHARVYSELEGAELVGVVDIQPERTKEISGTHRVRAYTDYRELFGKVEAVSLAVPTVDHMRIGVDLLEHGIDVLVEKPISSTTSDAGRLITTANEQKRVLQVGHVERFNPVVTAACEVARSPQFFEVHRLAAFSPRSLDIDVVLDLMIHDLDILLNLVKSPVREVRAVGIPVLSEKADIANARVEFESGCVANLTASRISFERVRKLRFFQPHDYISIDYASQKGTVVSLRMGRVIERKLEPREEEPLKLEIQSFLDAVSGKHLPVVTGEDGLRALDLAILINDEIERRSKKRDQA